MTLVTTKGAIHVFCVGFIVVHELKHDTTISKNNT
jgi:hypothetical protein